MSVIIAACVVAGGLIYIARTIKIIWAGLEGFLYSFLAIESTKLSVELDEAGYKSPEWLGDLYEEDTTVTHLSVVPFVHKKKEE